jgi:hypothetical protein
MAKSNTAQIGYQQPRELRFRMPRVCGSALDDAATNDPNKWFADKFPEAAQQYGAAFLEGTWTDTDGLKRFIPAYLNEDFFAAILGGDKRLGHHVVYFQSEDTFYFYDYKVDAYCPTSEEKLKLLLSNYLIRFSEECGALVDVTNLVVKFRKDDALESIIAKAKAVLEAERLFFEGKDGHRRYVDGKYIEPNEEPSYQLFVKKAIVREPEGRVTVADAFHRYYEFCKSQGQQPLTRQEFKHLVAEVIRGQFNIGLRHDVLTASGKQGHGWYGVRLDVAETFGRN